MTSFQLFYFIHESLQVADNKSYGIIMDGTQDETGDEQISMCFRHVDSDLDIHEDFVGLYGSPSTTGETLARVAEDVLKRLNLDIQDARAQTYDGASNMQG